MSSEIEKLCVDLSNLLEDIIQYISMERHNKISDNEKKIANSLIDRSKAQLLNISKTQDILKKGKNAGDLDYVDMAGAKKTDSEQEKHTVYCSVEDPVVATSLSETTCPYEDLPAKEASFEVKYGYLLMKKRLFLLGIEKKKRVFVAIHDNWMLIYRTDRDLKPLFMFDLKFHKAKEINVEKQLVFFEVISIRSTKKVYHFTALTFQDMKQWVSKINLCHNSTQKITEEPGDQDGNYDIIEPNNNEDEEDTGSSCSIYEKLDLKSLNCTSRRKQKECGPKLPDRIKSPHGVHGSNSSRTIDTIKANEEPMDPSDTESMYNHVGEKTQSDAMDEKDNDELCNFEETVYYNEIEIEQSDQDTVNSIEDQIYSNETMTTYTEEINIKENQAPPLPSRSVKWKNSTGLKPALDKFNG